MATEIEEIFGHIADRNHFLLSGGAGSGKTHTLIDLLQNIFTKNPIANVACITFTNVASDEIKERANFENLSVSTIHDFLWLNISGYQIDLKKALVELFPEEGIILDEIEKVDYREYKSHKKGIVSHDDIMILSEYLFKKFPLLSRILKDKYDFILVDEYQDTFKPVTEILLNLLNQSEKRISIGFFGDSMQSIFEKGIGDINEYLENDDETIPGIKEVLKKINRRNPQTVIDLANKIRLDNLKQIAEENSNAPNNDIKGNIKVGNIKFLYSESNSKSLDDIMTLPFFDSWDFDDPKQTKELFLSHYLIAGRAGFSKLMDIYYKDKIVGDGYLKRIKDYIKTNNIVIEYNSMTFLEVIESLIKLINSSLTYEKAMKMLLEKLANDSSLTYLRAANSLNTTYPGIKEVLPTDSHSTFISENPKLFKLAGEIVYEQIIKIYLDKDKLIGKKKSRNEVSNRRADERDYLIKYLMRIQEILFLFQNKKYFELISKVDFKIKYGKDKALLKENLKKLDSIKDKSIGVIIEEANNLGICLIDDRTNEFIESNKYLVERVKEVSFVEITKLYYYVEDMTVYSTQHGIKGAEFKNVLISLDKSGDRKLSYKYLFEQEKTREEIVQRTQKLFYVCCTRAMDNLVVFYQDDYSENVRKQAIEWFGAANVIDLDK